MNFVKIVKYILYIINSLYLLFGILLIAAGSILLSDFDEMNSIPISSLVWGCVMFVIVFLGCYGTIKENASFTIAYAVIMLISFVLRFSFALYILTHSSNILKVMEVAVIDMWKDRHVDKDIMNILQIAFDCCGKNNYTDYVLAGENIPLTCCGPHAKTCSEVNAKTRPGCVSASAKQLDTDFEFTRYGELVISFVELFASICGGFLAIQMRKSANY